MRRQFLECVAIVYVAHIEAVGTQCGAYLHPLSSYNETGCNRGLSLHWRRSPAAGLLLARSSQVLSSAPGVEKRIFLDSVLDMRHYALTQFFKGLLR